MSFRLMDISDFLPPKRKNGNGKKNGNGNGKLTNDFGGINIGSFGDLGAGFNGRFKNIGGGFIESVNVGRQPSINFAEGGRSKESLSPLFSDIGVKGFGFKRGRLEKIADKELRETKKKGKKKKNGNGEKGETLGGVIARKISERRKRSQFTKEQLEREKEADKRTRARLEELIEEEKRKKAEARSDN